MTDNNSVIEHFQCKNCQTFGFEIVGFLTQYNEVLIRCKNCYRLDSIAIVINQEKPKTIGKRENIMVK